MQHARTAIQLAQEIVLVVGLATQKAVLSREHEGECSDWRETEDLNLEQTSVIKAGLVRGEDGIHPACV